MRARALRYGTECTLSYLDLLEHVLVVSGVRDGAGEALVPEQTILSLGEPLLEHCSGSTCEAGTGNVSRLLLPQHTGHKCGLGEAAVRIQRSLALRVHQRGKASVEEGWAG